MQILDLLGMYFVAVVVFVKKTSLLFRLALAILWFVLTFFLTSLFKPIHFVKMGLIIPSLKKSGFSFQPG